ncbi:uncharacterized protein LOC125042576 isoform X2 [Penaeus chinensis]|uniref:uncharacterized protein LOC125042576 isoform X2 n=1 Tax=Penaeus chinensis TaxID=139456 RepID=UPI001FB84903|nr:uncharacterized protein LOC125042576 isoform X2 [Penaeus chinensis]
MVVAMNDSGKASDSTAKRGRSDRRVRRPDTWKLEVAKKKRNTGVAYVSASTGKNMPARSVGPLCNCGCMARLGDKVNAVFEQFWQIGNYERQNEYISRLVHSVGVQRSRVEPGKQSRRTQTLKYKVMSGKIEHEVCAAGFLSIHGISRKRVRTVMCKLQSPGVIERDRRGLGGTATRVAPQRRELVREHIRSFPSVSSHYSQAKSPNRPKDLSISKMYRLYQKWLEDEHPKESMVTLSYYRSVFKEDFHLSLDPPKVDLCNKYEEQRNPLHGLGENADAACISEVKRDRSLHLQRPRIARTKNNQDTTHHTIAMDLRQTLPTPRTYAGDIRLSAESPCHKKNEQKPQVFLHQDSDGFDESNDENPFDFIEIKDEPLDDCGDIDYYNGDVDPLDIKEDSS